MYRRLGALLLAATSSAAVAGCGGAVTHLGHRAQPHLSARNVPVAGPPATACAFPSRSQISNFKRTVQLVVDATVQSHVTTGSSSDTPPDLTTGYRLMINKVLYGSGATVDEVYSIVLDGPYSWILQDNHRYVLFLDTRGAQPYPSDGSAGVFDISDGTTVARCASYGHPDSPRTAQGQGEGQPASDFETSIASS